MGVAPFDAFFGMAQEYTSNFDLHSVVTNPASLLTMATPAVAVGGAALSKLNSTKQQAQQAATTAKTEIGTLNTNLTTTTQKLESTTTDLNTANLNLDAANKQIEALKAAPNASAERIAQLEKEKESLLTQLTALNNIQARATVLADNKEVKVPVVM